MAADRILIRESKREFEKVLGFWFGVEVFSEEAQKSFQGIQNGKDRTQTLSYITSDILKMLV